MQTTGSSSCSYLLGLSIIWTFLQSGNSFFARYLSTMSWEEWASLWVAIVLLMPREPFALIYFFATFLTFLPGVRLSMFETSGSVPKSSVHVDYAFLLTLVFFFPTYNHKLAIYQNNKKLLNAQRKAKQVEKEQKWIQVMSRFCWNLPSRSILRLLITAGKAGGCR